MRYKSLYKYDEVLLKEVANLHNDALSYRSFITNFGINFLLEIYKGILAARIGFFVIAQENDRVIGFVLCCSDSDRIFMVMLKRCLILLKIIFPIVFRNPSLIKRLIETSLYFQKENVNVKPELLVIAVRQEFRSKQIGTNLVEELEKQFKKNGVSRYKVTVHNAMTDSNRFYLDNGMKILKTFYLYDTQWNLFAKDIL